MKENEEEEPIRVTLTIHPAFTKTIPLPLAILSYRTLGLSANEGLYLIHMLAALLQGEEVNMVEIAKQMGVSERSLRRYNKALRQRDLLGIQRQFENNLQAPNSYSLDKLLDLLSEELEVREHQQTKLSDITRLLDQLASQLDEPNLDAGKVLGELVERWKLSTGPSRHDTGSRRTPEVARHDTVSRREGDTVSRREGDTVSRREGDTVSRRPPEVAPLGHGVTGNDDDDLPSSSSNQLNHHHHQSPVTMKVPPIVEKLEAIGFSQKAAIVLLGRAKANYSNGQAVAAVEGWVEWATWKAAHDPSYFKSSVTGFLLNVIGNGQAPNVVPVATMEGMRPCPRCKTPIPTYKQMCVACADAAGIVH